MKSARNQRVCGYCAGAALASDGPLAAHLRCPGSGCACHETNHIVTGEIAATQRAYVGVTESERNQK